MLSDKNVRKNRRLEKSFMEKRASRKTQLERWVKKTRAALRANEEWELVALKAWVEVWGELMSSSPLMSSVEVAVSKLECPVATNEEDSRSHQRCSQWSRRSDGTSQRRGWTATMMSVFTSGATTVPSESSPSKKNASALLRDVCDEMLSPRRCDHGYSSV